MSERAVWETTGEPGENAEFEDLDTLLDEANAAEDEESGIVRSRPATDPPALPARAASGESGGDEPATRAWRPVRRDPPRPPRPTLSIAPPRLEALSRPPAVCFPPDAMVPSFDSAPPTLPATVTPPPAANTVPPRQSRSRGSLAWVPVFLVGVGVGALGLEVAHQQSGWGAEGEASGAVLVEPTEAAAPVQGGETETSEASEAVLFETQPAERIIETRASAVVFPDAARRPAEASGDYEGSLGDEASSDSFDSLSMADRMRAAAGNTGARAENDPAKGDEGTEAIMDAGTETSTDEEPAVAAPFDRDAAASALSAAAAAAGSCRAEGDPTGSARVQLTFTNSGNATSAIISGPPFAGTATGSCIARHMRSASVPPFLGSIVTVHKTVTIE